MKQLTPKQSRELKVLMKLVEEYIKSAKPIGSNTLKDAGFEDLSSATIRNYFSNLEELGFLKQQHTSGGRIPTDKAYRFFARECLKIKIVKKEEKKSRFIEETRQIASFLQSELEVLSQKIGYPVFLSSPRFDHDFVVGMRVIPIDSQRVLVILMTDFGVIKTEQISVSQLITKEQALKIETYFEEKLQGKEKSVELTEELQQTAKILYNEALLRFISGYSSFREEDVYKTGISHLLKYPDFFDTQTLTAPLTFFENTSFLRNFLRECRQADGLSFWVGDDLIRFGAVKEGGFASIGIPYFIHKVRVGALALLGPSRMPYDTLFIELTEFSQKISATLTESLYKYQITFREAKEGDHHISYEEQSFLGKSRGPLLEDKTHDRRD
jgi:heat-inducible transcriptional repressor